MKRTVRNGVMEKYGSNVLFDLDPASTFFNFEDLANLHMDTARFEWMMDGRMNNGRDASGKAYICTIGPKDSILNSSSPLPLWLMNDLTVEISLASKSAAILTLGAGTGLDYNIEDVEILCYEVLRSVVGSTKTV